MKRILLVTLLLACCVELLPRARFSTLETSGSTEIHFEDSLQHLYQVIGLEQYDLSYEIFQIWHDRVLPLVC